MQSAVRIVQLIRLAMLVSVVFYAGVATSFAPHGSRVNTSVFYVLTALAAFMVVGVLMVRRLFVAPAEALLASQIENTESQPKNAAVAQRWQVGYILTYVFCEAIALYGLVLQFLGFSLSQVAPFYVASIALMLFFSPRPPSRELG
jgi:F0F1-type ATP synthase membrane subunit c/vacuolar-type H+-ATPase subunit K